MPKKLKSDDSHPLRDLREIIGEIEPSKRSQHKFAEFLGVSRSLIDKIERQQIPCTDELADIIAGLTGVRAECVAGTGTRPIKTFSGQIYSAETYRNFRAIQGIDQIEDVAALTRLITLFLNTLLTAAARKRKLFQVVIKLDDVIEDIRTRLQLGNEMDKILEEATSASGEPIHYDNLSQFAESLGGTTEKQKADLWSTLLKLGAKGFKLDAQLTVTRTMHRIWHRALRVDAQGNGLALFKEKSKGFYRIKQDNLEFHWPIESFEMVAITGNTQDTEPRGDMEERSVVRDLG